MTVDQEKLNRDLIDNAREENLKQVKYLIEKGADVNAKDNEGNTALIKSSRKGYLEVVKCLIEKGADINTKNNCGITIVHFHSKIYKSIANNYYK